MIHHNNNKFEKIISIDMNCKSVNSFTNIFHFYKFVLNLVYLLISIEAM